jgi:hypothetical protein
VTPHIPLAAITTSAGNYSELDGDSIDCRGRSMFQVCGAAAGSLKLLDWQESLKDELNFTTLEPASPAIGDRYLNTATGSSSVRGQSVTANRVYQWNGASWTETTPTEGAAVLVEDRDMLIGYNGSAWVDIGTFALLNEAQAFFSATNITGAEAETLTNASNADALHVHGASGLQANAVTTAKIADDAVDKTKIAADLAGNGLGQNADGSLEVKVDGTGIEINADTLRLKDGGVATAKIAADAVDKTKINADVAGSGLVQNPDGSLEIYPDDSTVEISADMLKLKDGGVTAAKLAAAVQDLMPNLLLTGANHADGTGAMTIQARDAANNNLAQRFLVRAWIADAEYSEPDPQTGFSVTTGELMRTIEANADLEVISDATGLAAMDINTGGAKTVYVMAKVDGRIYTGSVSITGP